MMKTDYPNPAGTDGFDFLEFVSPQPEQLRQLLTALGFTKVGQHQQKAVEWWKQNDANFLINAEAKGQAKDFMDQHQAGASSMGFRVSDAKQAYQHCLANGAKAYQPQPGDWCDVNKMPAIKGIDGTLIYLVDGYEDGELYRQQFDEIPGAMAKMYANNAGIVYLDHLTHNLYRGNLDKMAKFYEDLFNFREIRYFDIEGQHTGLLSRAMTGPCNKLRIPLNESADDDAGKKDQIKEFLEAFNGEGIQHIALGVANIYETVKRLKESGIEFMDTPDTYYEGVDKRVPNHGEHMDLMKKYRILIDGAKHPDGGRLLQIFTETVIGPVFFEIIQRKGDEGFGEGNFKALFESMELDQIRRGILKVDEEKESISEII